MWQAVSISTVLSSQWEGKTLKGFKPAPAPASATTLKKLIQVKENIWSGFWLSDFCFVLRNRSLIKFHTKSWHQFHSVSVIQSYYALAHEFFLSPWWENVHGCSIRETVHISSYQELSSIYVSNPYKYICRCRTLVPCSQSSTPFLGNAVSMKLLDKILKESSTTSAYFFWSPRKKTRTFFPYATTNHKKNIFLLRSE